MKALWPKMKKKSLIIVFAGLIGISLAGGLSWWANAADDLDRIKDALKDKQEKRQAPAKLIRRKEAMLIAERLPVAAAFYALNEGRYVNCIEKSVTKSCDSDWVTCIDDAWVVKFSLGEWCKVEHDERLAVTVVVDATDGSVISRYPEVEYFNDPYFCRDTPDCLCSSTEKGVSRCLNFVHGQIDGEVSDYCRPCVCVDQACVQEIGL